MPLHLVIENETALPDGGPISITVNSGRGIDIGRDQYLDWVLHDPTRFISGKHCEVRYRDGRYWIADVSTNGTFMNGSEFRIDGAQPLKTGDRLEIGRYIIAVTVYPEANESAQAISGSPSEGQLWDIDQPSAPAINPQALRQPSISTGLSVLDPMDWASDIPSVGASLPSARQMPAPSDSWQWGNSPGPAPAPFQPPPAPRAQFEPDLTPQPEPQPRSDPAFDGGVPPFTPPPTSQDGTLQPFVAEPALPHATPLTLPATAQTVPPFHPPAPQPSPQAQPGAAMSASVAQMQGASLRASGLPAQTSPGPNLPGTGNFRAAFAKGAGVDPGLISIQDEQALAEMLGAFVRITADNLRQLHAARAQSKGAMRSSNMTMIQALDNNPLRFSPNTEDAFRILFGPATPSYLSPQKALESSFHDVKKHQVAVFSAMQTALTKLMEDLDPDKIDASVEQDKGVSSLLRSRQARLWERYETAWKARAGKSEHGMLDVFMRLFTEAYDKSP